MLYPNLQININKKRGAGGLDDAQLINTPVILDLAVEMSEDKNNFAFNQQPSLNQFKNHERFDEKHNSLQTPILNLEQVPFFNPTSSAISPSDSMNSFVAPNDILNTYKTTATSTSSTSNINSNSTYNDLNQPSHLNSNTLQLTNDLNQHPLSIQTKILQQVTKQQESNIHQNYQFTSTTTPYTSTAQTSQYTSDILNHQTNLNDNLSHLNQQIQQQQQQLQQNLTYTELKPSNQSHLIPNSVYDVSGDYKSNKNQDQPPSYQSPSSPANSLSSQTSSSNLDNQDSNFYSLDSSSTTKKSTHYRYHGQSSQSCEKKSRMTKKQKYDAMINEEKNLIQNNERLKNDIKNLEIKIDRYKQTIMNTVHKNK